MPFLYRHVAVMPDVHYGKGSTVGTVLPTKGAIIPAAVGVDIGCGMIAVRTNIKKVDILGKLRDLRMGIERRIPMSAGKFNHKITVSAQRRLEKLEDTPGLRVHRSCQTTGAFSLERWAEEIISSNSVWMRMELSGQRFTRARVALVTGLA